MSSETPDETVADAPAAGDGAVRQPTKPHGDPLLASTHGADDGDDGTRHGWAATAGTGFDPTGSDASSDPPADPPSAED